ncbi:MAG: amidohydrolase family protein [Sphingomonadaceae bacterium]|nr:amidohydrolase family protein [Sphingomonadaceae bacterium]
MAGPTSPLLIRGADILGFGRGDMFISDGRIAQIGRSVPAADGCRTIDARGGALLPGLHDHHIHLAGLAVRGSSIWCGPPDVISAEDLAAKLSVTGPGWIRAIGYHESVLDGLPDASQLDRFVPGRPLRMQHRSGRMWLLNSAALDDLLSRSDPPPGLERNASGYTGRLFDEDDWLRTALGSTPPDFALISAELAGYGITGLTDMSPHNGFEMAHHFAAQCRSGSLAQNVTLAGVLELTDAVSEGLALGPVKLHLHEAELPDFDKAVRLINAAHRQDRAIAIHCVSEVELVFALAALDEAGFRPGDRIEHASVTPPPQLEQMAAMGLTVCSQPHFVEERGDRYLLDVEPRLQGDLYRLKSLADAGIPLAGGSDAPFGNADPWRAMQAAVSRLTATGQSIGLEEALSPEEALSLYLADPVDLSRARKLEPGADADLCLLDRPWAKARTGLSSGDLVATVISGRIVHDCINEPPTESLPG